MFVPDSAGPIAERPWRLQKSETRARGQDGSIEMAQAQPCRRIPTIIECPSPQSEPTRRSSARDCPGTTRQRGSSCSSAANEWHFFSVSLESRAEARDMQPRFGSRCHRVWIYERLLHQAPSMRVSLKPSSKAREADIRRLRGLAGGTDVMHTELRGETASRRPFRHLHLTFNP